MKKVRIILLAFVTLLVLSGVTAFPLRTEMAFLMQHKHTFPQHLGQWIEQVYDAINATPDVVLYGTDWLAFAHIIIALFFVPVYLHPVRYKANVLVGMAACLAVFPLAFICGPIRGIPFFHQIIDCCFGVGGILVLYYLYKSINRLEKQANASTH
ncbi:MAG: hypothetical protein IT236_17100 [Bacteroidia bacterium]|nr:hypothetical protein [Bacteroidia bacterium]